MDQSTNRPAEIDVLRHCLLNRYLLTVGLWTALLNLTFIFTTYASEPQQQFRQPMIELHDLRWQNRVLIVAPTSADATELLNAWMTEYTTELQERKLRVIDSEQLSASEKYRPDCEDGMLLVGLDGGIKYQNRISADSLETIFALIDAMPMRKAELQRKTPR